MNQRVFPRLSSPVKFLTKCHSFSVSIETSEPFSWLPHLSLAVFQSIISLRKEYLEQTVSNVYGKPTDKREKRQTRKNDLFTYLLIVNIIQESDEATLKENWRCRFLKADFRTSSQNNRLIYPMQIVSPTYTSTLFAFSCQMCTNLT